MAARKQDSWLELELSPSTFHMLLFPVRYTELPTPLGAHFPESPVLHSCALWGLVFMVQQKLEET